MVVLSFLVMLLMRRAYGDVTRGRFGLVSLLASKDVAFVFPGESSFGGTYRGKEELLGWLRRFSGLHPQIEVVDAMTAGPPWRMRVAVRLDDSIGEDYRNRVVEVLHLRWGKLQRLEVFLDTERVTEWENAAGSVSPVRL